MVKTTGYIMVTPSGFIQLIAEQNNLIRTAPPRKEISVTFKMDEGSTVTKVIDVILYPDQTFGLAGVLKP